MDRKPGPKVKLLNVRQHLDHVQEIVEAFQKYGDCPLVRSEMAKVSLINRAIIRNHDAQRTAGQRKDIRV